MIDFAFFHFLGSSLRLQYEDDFAYSSSQVVRNAIFISFILSFLLSFWIKLCLRSNHVSQSGIHWFHWKNCLSCWLRLFFCLSWKTPSTVFIEYLVSRFNCADYLIKQGSVCSLFWSILFTQWSSSRPLLEAKQTTRSPRTRQQLTLELAVRPTAKFLINFWLIFPLLTYSLPVHGTCPILSILRDKLKLRLPESLLSIRWICFVTKTEWMKIDETKENIAVMKPT